MIDRKTLLNDVKVGGPIFEELAFEHFAKKYNISKEELQRILEEKQKINKNISDTISSSIPLSILSLPELSSLEAIVKFLRENKKVSYNIIGTYLHRNPKTLAATYAVAHKKMHKLFSKEYNEDTKRIPFTVFSLKLSVLECICHYLKSQNNSYAEISRMLRKDQRTIWTVCKRAENKLEKEEQKKKEEPKKKEVEEKGSSKVNSNDVEDKNHER